MHNMISKFKEKYASLHIGARAAIWYTICNFLQKGISLITVPVFTRLLTTDEYGTYTVFTSWESIISIFATLNLTYYVFDKGMVKYEDDRDNFVVSLQSLGSLACIIVFLIYFALSGVLVNYTKLSNPIMLMMFVYLLFIPATKFWSARQRFEYKYKRLVFVTLGGILLNFVLGLLLVLTMEDGGFARILSIVLASSSIGLVFYITNLKKATSKKVTTYWKYALAFNIPLIPHFLTSIILHNADRIMINNMCGASTAAIYAVAYSGGNIMVLINNAVQQSLLPWIYTRMKRENYNGMPALFNKTLLLVGGINLLLITFAPEAISILAPAKYHEAVWVIPPIAASVFFMYLYNLFANIEMYYEESKLITATSIGLSLLNVALNYIFIKLFGYIAAGYTTLFCYILYSAFHFLMMKYILKRHENKATIFDLKAIVLISASIIVLSFILMMTYEHFVIRYTVVGIAAIFCVIFRKKIVSAIKDIRNTKQSA